MIAHRLVKVDALSRNGLLKPTAINLLHRGMAEQSRKRGIYCLFELIVSSRIMNQYGFGSAIGSTDKVKSCGLPLCAIIALNRPSSMANDDTWPSATRLKAA